MVSAGEGAISASGAVTETITEKGKRVAKEILFRNKSILFTLGVFGLLFIIVATSLFSCSASIQGGKIKMRIEQKITKRKRIIVRLFVVSLILSSLIFIKLLLNRMDKYIDENGKSSMRAVIEQMQQTYDLQVNGYYSQLHLLEDSLLQEKELSLILERNDSTSIEQKSFTFTAVGYIG